MILILALLYKQKIIKIFFKIIGILLFNNTLIDFSLDFLVHFFVYMALKNINQYF